MMKVITTFFNEALKAIDSSTSENRVTMESINLLCEEPRQRIIDSKQDCSPNDPEDKIVQFFDDLNTDLIACFEKNFSY
jgi:hypothetical protein